MLFDGQILLCLADIRFVNNVLWKIVKNRLRLQDRERTRPVYTFTKQKGHKKNFWLDCAIWE